MAKIECPCGEILGNGEVPNDIVIWAYPDKQFREMMSYIGREKPNPEWRDSRLEIWRCPYCGRMLVFENYSLAPIVYKIEEE